MQVHPDNAQSHTHAPVAWRTKMHTQHSLKLAMYSWNRPSLCASIIKTSARNWKASDGIAATDQTSLPRCCEIHSLADNQLERMPRINRILIPFPHERKIRILVLDGINQNKQTNKRAIVWTNEWMGRTDTSKPASDPEEGGREEKHGGTERRGDGIVRTSCASPPVRRILYLSIYLYIRGSSRRVLEYGSDLLARKENGRDRERDREAGRSLVSRPRVLVIDCPCDLWIGLEEEEEGWWWWWWRRRCVRRRKSSSREWREG